VHITIDVADRLSALGTQPEELVFQSIDGTILDPDNLYRVLKPACEEAGVGWADFHTFRHTVASRLLAEGRNVVQVQRWLGHHSPSFTLDTYVHLLEDNLGEPLAPQAAGEGPPVTEASIRTARAVRSDGRESAAPARR
jgi:integrase